MAEKRSQLVEVVLPDGTVVLAETSGSAGGDVGGGLRRFSMDEAATALSGVGQWALETVRASLPEQPDSLEVEFGLKLAVKTGKLFGVLAEASGESSLLIRMSWDKETGTDAARAG